MPVPLQFRAAFANYLMHGMTPAEAKRLIAAQIAAAQDRALN